MINGIQTDPAPGDLDGRPMRLTTPNTWSRSPTSAPLRPGAQGDHSTPPDRRQPRGNPLRLCRSRSSTPSPTSEPRLSSSAPETTRAHRPRHPNGPTSNECTEGKRLSWKPIRVRGPAVQQQEWLGGARSRGQRCGHPLGVKHCSPYVCCVGVLGSRQGCPRLRVGGSSFGSVQAALRTSGAVVEAIRAPLAKQ